MGAMVFGAYPASAAENSGAPFTDVWYAEAVEYVSGSGIMSGTGASRFSPDQTVSRGMLASVLYRMAGSPQTEGAAFNDIPEGSYYEQAAAWVNENGVMSGYGNGAFRGGEPVTREQLVSVLWRYYGSPESENDAEFSDESDISNYAVDAVNWAVSQGIISGVGNNRFNPKGTATRRRQPMFCKISPILAETARRLPRPRATELFKQQPDLFRAQIKTEYTAIWECHMPRPLSVLFKPVLWSHGRA